MRDLIYQGFSKDVDLLTTYHIEAGKGLDVCVQRTYEDLLKADPSFRFFEYREGLDLIGFFGTEFDNYVNTVFVMPEYRDKDHMARFWRFLTSKMPQVFYTALYSKNTRAINFYLRNGGKVIKTLNNNITLIEVTVCQ